MLKGIPSILSPELLKVLDEMGHSDEIVIADGNFPGRQPCTAIDSAGRTQCSGNLECRFAVVSA